MSIFQNLSKQLWPHEDALECQKNNNRVLIAIGLLRLSLTISPILTGQRQSRLCVPDHTLTVTCFQDMNTSRRPWMFTLRNQMQSNLADP